MSDPQPDTEELRKLVRAHHVVYECQAAEEIVGDERRKVGFDVVLSGTDGADDAVAVLGTEAAEVWRDLVRIGRAILPKPADHTVLALKSFDLSVHGSSLRQNRDDIELVIGIRHEPDALEPIDPAEEQTLRKVVDGLRALGIPEGQWKKIA